MSPLKQLIGECRHCGAHFEFSAELAGTSGTCPHCGAQTDFLPATPEFESPVPRKLVVWTVIGVLLLVFALLGSLLALRFARQMVKPTGPLPPRPASQRLGH